MDLLGGYGSDDSDDSSASDSAKLPVQSDATISKRQELKEVVSKKGKKLLRLNAVLPPDILDRLTKGAASDTDSDDDEEGRTKLNKREGKKFVKKKDITIGLGSSSAADNGLNSLLTDLSGFTPSVVVKKGEEKEEKLGMAFMTVSTSVSRKKRNEPSDVVDIHQSLNTNNKASKKIVVEDVDSDSEGETPSQNRSLTQAEEKDKAEPLFTSKPSSYIRRTVPRPPSGLSAGMKRPINATPMPSNYNSTLNPSAPSAERDRGQQYEQQEVQLPQKKRSKKEIEKALRAGNLDSVNEYTQKIESISSNTPNEQQILASSGLSEGGNSFGTSGLERYIPSEGASIKQGGLSGKMKGKHQIHALVSSAAKYEAEQRRMNAMGTNKGKSSRADAKKKYGW